MRKIANISLADYRQFLIAVGCELQRTKGGHEHWLRDDLARPLTLQTHIDPVPAFIVKQHLRYLQISTKDFLSQMEDL
jgi:hypothetical protein